MPEFQTRSSARQGVVVPSVDRLFHINSSIADSETNLQHFFSTCIANWDVIYTEKEKNDIIKLLPRDYQIYKRDEDGRLACPITTDFTTTDTVFRDAIAKFQREISEGYWTNTWRVNAKKASAERADGKFDEYLEQYFDELFSVHDDDKDGDDDRNNDDLESTSKARSGEKKRRDTNRRAERTKKSRHTQMMSNLAGEADEI